MGQVSVLVSVFGGEIVKPEIELLLVISIIMIIIIVD